MAFNYSFFWLLLPLFFMGIYNLNFFKRYPNDIELQRLLAATITGHNFAFGKDNLITEKISIRESTKWNGALSAAGEFVDQVAPWLHNDFIFLRSTSDNLLNTLNINYWLNVAPLMRSNHIKQKNILGNIWLGQEPKQPHWVHDKNTKRKIASCWKKCKKMETYLCVYLEPWIEKLLIIQNRLGKLLGKPGNTYSKGKEQQAVYLLHCVGLILSETIRKVLDSDLASLELMLNTRMSRRRCLE